MALINFGAGLAALGSSVAQTAGEGAINAQKADLENQRDQLLDQLTTTRETTLEAQRHSDELGTVSAQGDQSRQTAQATAAAQGDQARQTAGFENTLPVSAGEKAQLASNEKIAAGSQAVQRAALVPEEIRTASWFANATPAQQQAFQQSIAAKNGVPMWSMPGGTSVTGANGGSSGASDGSSTGSGGGSGGTDSLKALPPAAQATVKAMIEGRLTPPTSMALSKPYWQTMIAVANSVDPTFDETTWSKRVATSKDFGSGQSAKAVTAMNTALGHAGLVMDDLQKLKNYGGVGTPLNAPLNAFESYFGDQRPTNATEAVGALASEARKVFAATGGGNLTELQSWEKSFPINGSPDQQKGALKTFVGLLDSRLSSLSDQYNRGMQKTDDPVNLLNSHARQVYQNIMGEEPQDATGYPTGKAPSPSGSMTPDVTALPDPNKREVGKTYATPTGPHVWMGQGWAAAPSQGGQ